MDKVARANFKLKIGKTEDKSLILYMAKKKKKHRNNGNSTGEYVEVEVNHGLWDDYLDYGPQYDTVNDCPIIPDETRFIERTRFKKVPIAAKRLMREFMCNQIEEFWNENRQIPDGGQIKKMRKASTDYLLHDFEIFVKDDAEVAHYLNECVTPTINRLLKKESQP